MAKIQVLDKSVSELIAAGEVIERPASIVKELLENAIDAKASAVTVEIKQGGIGFIRITDNGIGIAREDVPTAFLRHATSKVRTEDDLTNIATLGFRGEALASVCAVAKVELITKTAGQELGSRYLIQGGENGTLEEAGCPNGTTIIVRDLFYNVPARLKFLKKDFSEGNAVQGIVEKIALSHPEVSVKLIKENKTVLHTSGNRDLRSAIYSVFGKDFAAGLLPVNYQHNGIRVSGFITKPACSRTNRSMQHFFVNDRYVKTRTGMAALEEGYKHSIMVGKFPACVLKLGIDYSLVDVNVHPAKIEIRFVQERPVFEAIYFAVKSALEQEDILKSQPKSQRPELLSTFYQKPTRQTQFPASPSVPPKPADPVKETSLPPGKLKVREYPATPAAPQMTVQEPVQEYDFQAPKRSVPVSPAPQSAPKQVFDEAAFSFLKRENFQKQEQQEPETIIPEAAPPQPEPEQETPVIRMIGEVFKTYILFETEDLFIMLDKHAAHERILYEKLKKQIHLKQSQLLLAPVPAALSTEEMDALLSHRDLLRQMGFDISQRDGKLQVTEAPVVLSRYPLGEIMEDLAKNILLCKIDVTPQVFDDLLHSMACRAAIKANEDNTPEELQELAQQVYFDHKIRHCPHGRPVGITMTKYEIEKKFGRHN
ncbi:DNA mismatch repair protein mutL [uncultured Ruminococcus sp.]|nr:DNA mismatch repair protein mutL [uncultured Ruminococcus sp.]SCH70774.1 DNA mismatch repair protein mutL [uncultured Clostridium sp.]